jgi:large subunit ribosomal protein L21
VTPGEVVRIEKAPVGENNLIEFSDVLAFANDADGISQPSAAKVTATVVEEGRGEKILVFHYKRKKQYKKLQGHRQAYTAVRINEIEVNGTTYRAE